MRSYLDFEKPIADLEGKVQELKALADGGAALPIDDDIAHDLLEAKLHGAMVVDIRTFYEHVVQRLPLSQITEEWLLQTEGFSLNTRGSLRRLKRAFDLFLSLMLLIPAAPIMLITALLIRLESPGPVIYRQDRVGL